MSHDDESAFLHSDDLRASWVHLRESLLEGSSVSFQNKIYSHSGRLMGMRTDVRNRRAFARKLKVIADDLRQRMVGGCFTPKSSPCTNCLSGEL